MIEVYLKKNADKKVMSGESWVYANEVAEIKNKDKNGSLATVFSYEKKFIGKGYINFLSKILVRIFIRDPNTEDSAELFEQRISYADKMRREIVEGDNYRAVYAEADDLPALIIDRYNDTIVTQFLSLGMDRKKDEIVNILKKLYNPKCIYERSDASVREKEGLPLSKGVLFGTLPEEILIHENGLTLDVDVKDGQKTGYFLDQKFNREAIKKYCKNKTVLDCFCNCGGFALNAATLAQSVVAVDVSENALNSVVKNANLNNLTNISVLKADVFELLRTYNKEGKQFDVIILDPPAFTKSANQTEDAVRGYRDINLLAIKIVTKGGYLVTSSCSHYVDMPLFLKTIKQAAQSSHRQVRLCEIKTQSPDHYSLLSSDMTTYLKFLILKID